MGKPRGSYRKLTQQQENLCKAMTMASDYMRATENEGIGVFTSRDQKYVFVVPPEHQREFIENDKPDMSGAELVIDAATLEPLIDRKGFFGTKQVH